ncbi:MULTISPECIES: hypothetical protein [unclassified Vibrio]|uniref:Uncharacterized protein n=1 Tax=Vibrio sp. HB236076 TaxID=3232307 RepID=A0AB39HEC9_9VIBR|nr:hypothetical protein [Vibrio sp. HB161653]MDP5254253.1 hypothetical protein [Vibrio sp. HB161653]
MTDSPIAGADNNTGSYQNTRSIKGMEVSHQHPPREVSSQSPIPSVSHLMFPDVMDGFNVQILTRHFTFTPASINQAPNNNQGHAHIYVNDVKIARVYSSWFHLPRSLFKTGDNVVKVTLNANDHGEWSINGNPISSVVKVVIPAPKSR